MVKNQSIHRIGIYECEIRDDGVVRKGRSTEIYSYGLYSREFIKSTILPKLREAKNAGYDFDFPVLVTSWILGKGDPPKPLPRPEGPLFVSKVGGLRKLKRMVGIPTQRKKMARSEKWEAVIDAEGQVFELENNNRVKDS